MNEVTIINNLSAVYEQLVDINFWLALIAIGPIILSIAAAMCTWALTAVITNSIERFDRNLRDRLYSDSNNLLRVMERSTNIEQRIEGLRWYFLQLDNKEGIMLVEALEKELLPKKRGRKKNVPNNSTAV